MSTNFYLVIPGFVHPSGKLEFPINVGKHFITDFRDGKLLVLVLGLQGSDKSKVNKSSTSIDISLL